MELLSERDGEKARSSPRMSRFNEEVFADGRILSAIDKGNSSGGSKGRFWTIVSFQHSTLC
jgi:hypothetical protein